MNSHTSDESSFWGARISSSIYLNSGSQEQKYTETNSIAYKPIVEESLLAQPFKVFVKNGESRLAILHRTCTKKMG